MTEFQREHRYWLIKRKHLTSTQDELFSQLCGRLRDEGVPEVEAVVIESDWPIYDETWESVQRLAEGEPSIREERDALAAHVKRLSAKAEACANELAALIDRHNTQNMEDGSWTYDHQTPHELMMAVRDVPANSLACLKAQWQAEALEAADCYLKDPKDRATLAKLAGVKREEQMGEGS